MDKPGRIIISMPLSYWEMHAGFWKLTPQDLKDAMKREDKIIGRLRNGDIIKIGNESNKR
jgi:hypothetical protein